AKWVDYLAPQIYWEYGHATADFGKQAKYWNDNAAGVPIVIGIAAYKFKDPAYPAFGTANEFGRQIDETRNLSNLYGCIWVKDISKTNVYTAKLVAVVADLQFSGISGKSYTITSVNEEKSESLYSNVVTLY
ncbi:MAG: hypothetical protein Q7J86_12670, partial [Bacteroidota bacterium]|nr:hypothetical protein [Bacteroidota bacterium]